MIEGVAVSDLVLKDLGVRVTICCMWECSSLDAAHITRNC